MTLPPGQPGKAIVRFQRRIKRANSDSDTNSRYVASLSFKYEPQTRFTKEKILVANPMGFMVDGYAVDAEMGSSSSEKEKAN